MARIWKGSSFQWLPRQHWYFGCCVVSPGTVVLSDDKEFSHGHLLPGDAFCFQKYWTFLPYRIRLWGYTTSSSIVTSFFVDRSVLGCSCLRLHQTNKPRPPFFGAKKKRTFKKTNLHEKNFVPTEMIIFRFSSSVTYICHSTRATQPTSPISFCFGFVRVHIMRIKQSSLEFVSYVISHTSLSITYSF